MASRAVFLAAFGLLLLPAVARAQTAPPVDPSSYAERSVAPPVSALTTTGLTGFELELRGMVQQGGGDSPVQAPTLWNGQNGNAGLRGTILDPGGAVGIHQSYSPYGIDPLAFGATLGYRFHRNFSAGVFFSFAQYSSLDGTDATDATNGPDGTSGLQRQQWNIGVYGRYYLTRLHPRLHPWVEVGIGYNGDIAVYSRTVGQRTGAGGGGGPEEGNFTLRQDGIVVPVTLGLDVRPSPSFSVGPMLGYWRVFPVKGCVEVVLDQYSEVPATNTCAAPPVENHGYGSIFAGIFAKLTIDPFPR
jgi:hypothetical protein